MKATRFKIKRIMREGKSNADSANSRRIVSLEDGRGEVEEGLREEIREIKRDLKTNYERKEHNVEWRKTIEERVSKLEEKSGVAGAK